MNSVKSYSIMIIILISSSISLSQPANNILKGKIIDVKTGEPLIGVNVYVNNSTTGTTTNKNGLYEMMLSDGRYEIVASIIGFETDSKFINIKNKIERRLDFALKEKTYELKQVSVEGEFSQEWYKMLKLFKTYFLGQNEFSTLCKIKNEKDIYFLGNYDSVFTIHSYRPLTISNIALGYLMECTLAKFEIDTKNMISSYSIKTRFTDLIRSGSIAGKDWIANRRSAYIGSLRHFLYSAITKNELKDFEVALVKQTNYNEKGIRVYSRDEIFTWSDEQTDYLLSFKGLLRVRYKFSNNCAWIEIDGNDSYVNGNGYLLNPMSVLQYGTWAYSGMAMLLPLDYISI
jgi:hypothetical protein